MIWESRFWKDDLLKTAKKLQKQKTQRRWPEVSLARLEQSLMLGFYSIRKLHEAAKLSTPTMQQELEVVTYPWSGKNVTRFNWDKLDRLYDLETPTMTKRDLLFVCHQFVHSYIFTPAFDENNLLEGIFFASDRQKHKAVQFIHIVQIADVFTHVGNDYPNSASYILNPNTGDYDVVASMNP